MYSVEELMFSFYYDFDEEEEEEEVKEDGGQKNEESRVVEFVEKESEKMDGGE